MPSVIHVCVGGVRYDFMAKTDNEICSNRNDRIKFIL